jgi:hypothetical protein
VRAYDGIMTLWNDVLLIFPFILTQISSCTERSFVRFSPTQHLHMSFGSSGEQIRDEKQKQNMLPILQHQ